MLPSGFKCAGIADAAEEPDQEISKATLPPAFCRCGATWTTSCTDGGVGEPAAGELADVEGLMTIGSKLGDQVGRDSHVQQEFHEAIGSAGSTCSSASQAAYRKAWLTSSVSR